MTESGAQAARREHRLALVLYGGVSLCIYMHGTTKEINRLASASAGLAQGTDDEHSASETVYRELLQWLAARDGVRTDVVVDVIAGTSAGGINGVYLAKALAQNRSQDDLREMWLAEADIKLLLRGWRRLPVKLRAVLVLATLPWKVALRGKMMSRLLFKALASMDGKPAGKLETLVPQGSTLDLLVTSTDFYGYDRQAPAWDPRSVDDEQHRHVFHFTHANPGGGLGEGDNPALAFAARATSCFPGAFDPVSRPSFLSLLPPGSSIDDMLFRVYELAGAPVDQTFFVDGGVLDNRPFAPAIEAIRAKPADVHVKRTLLYLDPDPPPQLGRAPGKAPGVIATLLGAVSGLPRKQPILDSLLDVDRMNERVRELRDVIEVSFEGVAKLVRATIPEALAQGGQRAGLGEYERRLQTAAREQTDLAYGTYMRARITAMLDGLASASCTVCDYPLQTSQAMLVASSWQAWARRRGLLAQSLGGSEAQLELLHGLDVEYHRRRASFTLAGVNWIYEHETQLERQERRGLDALKARLWTAIVGLSQTLRDAAQELAAQIAACFPEAEMKAFLFSYGLQPAKWAEQREAELERLVGALAERLRPALADSDSRLYGDLLELTSGWQAKRREDLLVRFIGFPLWDAQLQPLESVSGVGERDAVKVMRTSPIDATLLRQNEDKLELRGVTYGHFGAFFARAARENDYLIGRLDGAERMVRMLIPNDGPDRIAWSRRAFLAILEEEEAVLGTATGLISQVRERAQALAGKS